MNFSGLTEYGREFRKLARKYKTLPEDMRNFRYVISSEILLILSVLLSSKKMKSVG